MNRNVCVPVDRAASMRAALENALAFQDTVESIEVDLQEVVKLVAEYLMSEHYSSFDVEGFFRNATVRAAEAERRRLRSL